MAIIRDLRNMHIYCQNIMIDKKDGYLNFLSCFVFIFTYSSQIGVIFFYFSYKGFFCRRLTVYFTISRQYNYTHDVKLDANVFYIPVVLTEHIFKNLHAFYPYKIMIVKLRLHRKKIIVL